MMCDLGFLEDDSGATTVDWVVVTAALLGLSMATAPLISRALDNSARRTSHVLSGVLYPHEFGPPHVRVEIFIPMGYLSSEQSKNADYEHYLNMSEADLIAQFIHTYDYAYNNNPRDHGSVYGQHPNLQRAVLASLAMEERGIELPAGYDDPMLMLTGDMYNMGGYDDMKTTRGW